MLKNVMTSLFGVLIVFGALAINSVAENKGAVTQPTKPDVSSPGTVSSSNPQGADDDGDVHWRKKRSLRSLVKTLGLTDEQKNKMRDLYVAFKDTTRKDRMAIRSLQDQKSTMLMSGKIDQRKLAEMDEQIVKIRSDILKERLKLTRDRLAPLSPEQIEKLGQWKAQKSFHKKMRKFHVPEPHA